MIWEKTEPELSMVRFLLGEMSDGERLSFEAEYIHDTSLFHRLVELENDLLDLYAIDALSSPERKRLERSFLIDAERRKRLFFSRAMMVYPEHETSFIPKESRGAIIPKQWFRNSRISLVAAMLLLASVTAISWLLLANHRLRTELAASRKQQEGATDPVASRQQNAAINESGSSLFPALKRDTADRIAKIAPGVLHNWTSASFTLTADGLRGNSNTPKLNIPPTAPFVLMYLKFSADSFSSYHLFLETAGGSQVWQKQHATSKPLGTTSKEIVIRVPSRIFKAGDYVLRITADNGSETEDVAGYSFSVIRR